MSNSFVSMQNWLRQISKDEGHLNVLQNEMLDLANRTRAPIDELSKAFVRFDKVNIQLWGTQAETLTILENLSKGLTLSGASAVEVGSTMLQLSQAFGSWRLAGDEFRAVSESMPMLLDIMAKSIWVPRWELKNLAADGKITSEVLKTALLGATDEINKAFLGSKVTIGQAMTVVKNDMLVTFGELDKLGGGTQEITKWILAIGDAMLKNGAIIGVSFIWMMKEVFSVFSEVWSSISTIFSGVMSFFIDENKNTTDWLAFSWKNLFLYLDLWLKAIMMTLHLLGNGIAMIFTESFFTAQVAFIHFKDAVKTIGSSVMAVTALIWVNIASGIIKGIKFAIKGLNWLIDALNNIPGLDIKKIGESFQAVESLSFESAIASSKAIFWISEQSWKDIAKLEAKKGRMLATQSTKTRAMLESDMNGMSDAYLNFTNAQNSARKSGEDLKNVLEEIRKAGNKVKDLWGGGWWTKKAVDEQKKAVDELQKLGKETANAIEGIFSNSVAGVNKQKSKLLWLKDDYQKLKEKLKEVGETGVKELQKIQDKLDKQELKIKNITGEGQVDIATRLIEAQKELQAIKDKQALGEWITNEELQKRFALEKEIALGESKTTWEERAKAIEESQKSEIQLILDKTAKKLLEAEQDRLETQKTYDAKKLLIEQEKADVTAQMEQKKAEMMTEFALYQSLIAQKQAIETQYFSLFQKNIKEQMDKTMQAINLVNQLKEKSGGQTVWTDGARALGWPVYANRSYLVGENWPEIFSPWSSGKINNNPSSGWGNITINLGGVIVQNSADEDRLVDKIRKVLIRETQLYSNGIA